MAIINWASTMWEWEFSSFSSLIPVPNTHPSCPFLLVFSTLPYNFGCQYLILTLMQLWIFVHNQAIWDTWVLFLSCKTFALLTVSFIVCTIIFYVFTKLKCLAGFQNLFSVSVQKHQVFYQFYILEYISLSPENLQNWMSFVLGHSCHASMAFLLHSKIPFTSFPGCIFHTCLLDFFSNFGGAHSENEGV